jgi:hypothetical protein
MTVTPNDIGVLVGLISAINGLAVYVMRLTIHEAISKNNDVMMNRINGSYLKTEVANLRFEQASTRSSAIEARLAVLEQLARSAE